MYVKLCFCQFSIEEECQRNSLLSVPQSPLGAFLIIGTCIAFVHMPFSLCLYSQESWAKGWLLVISALGSRQATKLQPLYTWKPTRCTAASYPILKQWRSCQCMLSFASVNSVSKRSVKGILSCRCLRAHWEHSSSSAHALHLCTCLFRFACIRKSLEPKVDS